MRLFSVAQNNSGTADFLFERSTPRVLRSEPMTSLYSAPHPITWDCPDKEAGGKGCSSGVGGGGHFSPPTGLVAKSAPLSWVVWASFPFKREALIPILRLGIKGDNLRCVSNRYPVRTLIKIIVGEYSYTVHCLAQAWWSVKVHGIKLSWNYSQLSVSPGALSCGSQIPSDQYAVG